MRRAATERGVGGAGLDAVARRVDVLLQAQGHRGVERVAGFDEGVERIGVEHLGPQVDVVARGVARAGEQVLEVGVAVVQSRARRQATLAQDLGLEGDHVLGHLTLRQRMHGHVGQRAGGVAHGLETLTEAACRGQPLDQRLGNRLAGDHVAGVAAQHRWLAHPVLEQLRGQLDEIAQHIGARQAFVAHARQQPVQAVAELVEQRAHVVEGQQRRFARRGLGEVVVVDDDRDHVAAVAGLLSQRTHPRAAALARAGEVVMQEDAGHAAVAAAHLVGLDVGVVDRQVGALRKAHAEQPLGAIEGRGHHAIEREVGFDLGVIDGVRALAHALGPKAPVPGFDLMGHAGFTHRRAELGALALERRQRALPDVVEQALDFAVLARHGVGQRVVGVAGVAVQRGLLGTQLQDLTHDGTVVAGTGVFAAARPGTPGRLAQVTPLAEGEERHQQRARQGDHQARQAPVGRGLAGRGAHEVRQAGEVGRAVEHQRKRRLVGQHVLAELCRQRRQPLHQRGVAALGRRRQARTGAHEVLVHLLEQAQRLGSQAEPGAALVQRVDAREHAGVHVDRIAVRGHRLGHLALHLLQRGRGFRRAQVVEHALQARQQPTRCIKARQRVVEARRRGLRGDGVELGTVLLHRHTQRGCEVLGAQCGERRQCVGRGPGLQQRIARSIEIVRCRVVVGHRVVLTCRP